MFKLRQTEDGIYYFHDYYPKNRFNNISEEDDNIRRAIWDYKKLEDEAMLRFTNELMKAISIVSKRIRTDKIGLVAVPPSKVDKDSPVRESIEHIYDWYNKGVTRKHFRCYKRIYDYGNLLTRVSDVPTSHEGVRATYDQHKESIKCKRSNLRKYGTAFIILDDVTTRGIIMDVCEDILIENGADADNIFKLAIARTV